MQAQNKLGLAAFDCHSTLVSGRHRANAKAKVIRLAGNNEGLHLGDLYCRLPASANQNLTPKIGKDWGRGKL